MNSTYEREGGKPGHITRARRTGRQPVARPCCYVLVFLCSNRICPVYKLTLSDQAQVTLQLTAVPN